MRKLLFLVALTLLPTPADASCAFVGMTPNVLTRRDTKLPADGGVLVGYTYGNDNDGEASGADPSDVKWTATSGKAKVTLTRTELAPGLKLPLMPTKPPKVPVPDSVPPELIVTGPETLPLPVSVAPDPMVTRPVPVADPVAFVTASVVLAVESVVPPL